MQIFFMTIVICFFSSTSLAQIEDSEAQDEPQYADDSEMITNPSTEPPDLDNEGDLKSDVEPKLTDPIFILSQGQFLGRTSLQAGSSSTTWTSTNGNLELESKHSVLSQELLYALTDIFLIGLNVPYQIKSSTTFKTSSLTYETDFDDTFSGTSVVLGARLPVTNEGKVSIEVEVGQKDWSHSEADFLSVELAGSYLYYRNFQLYFAAHYTTFGESVDLDPHDVFSYKTAAQILLTPYFFVQPEVLFTFAGDRTSKLSPLSFERVAYTGVSLVIGGGLIKDRLSWFANYTHTFGTVGFKNASEIGSGNDRENDFGIGLNYLF